MKKTYFVLLLLVCFLAGFAGYNTYAKVVGPPKSKIKTYRNNTNVDSTSTSTKNNSGTSEDTNEEAPPEQEFGSDVEEILAKANVFVNNATSFKEMVAKLNESNIDKAKDALMQIVDSMLENNANLQNITKKLANEQKRDEDKRFYLRQVLPNLHNMNRQLSRIKIAVDKEKINYKNMKYQSERVETSVQQIVDRIEGHGNK